MASFRLVDPSGSFTAFGQLYERFGRINLARLVVNPALRAQGVGKRLVEALMAEGSSLFSCDEYSLFVFRENTPAFRCYKSMGFVVGDYPDEMPHADVCYYLTRSVQK
jgi:ribosomal protein S18 acetylase RimI-like enzyme